MGEEFTGIILLHWKNGGGFSSTLRSENGGGFFRETRQTGSVWPRTYASAVRLLLLLTLWTHPSGLWFSVPATSAPVSSACEPSRTKTSSSPTCLCIGSFEPGSNRTSIIRRCDGLSPHTTLGGHPAR